MLQWSKHKAAFQHFMGIILHVNFQSFTDIHICMCESCSHVGDNSLVELNYILAYMQMYLA